MQFKDLNLQKKVAKVAKVAKNSKNDKNRLCKINAS